VSEIRDLMASYRLTIAVGDRYAAAWVVEAFARVGVIYQHSIRDKSEIYLNALPLFAAGRVSLLQHDRLAAQAGTICRKGSLGGIPRPHAAAGSILGHARVENARTERKPTFTP
jgi:hypothetical protein